MACRTLFETCLTGKLLACHVVARERAGTRPQSAHPQMDLCCIHRAQGACSSYELVVLTGSAFQAAPLQLTACTTGASVKCKVSCAPSSSNRRVGDAKCTSW